MWRSISLGLLVALALAATAQAAPELTRVADFRQPVHVTSPPGDPRLFVVERQGRVVVLDGGQQRTFLDLTSITNSGFGEQGLLSIAFPPDHAASGLSYVFLTVAGGDLVVLEHRGTDAATRREVLRIPHGDAANHNGGQLAFGPDGLMYVATGDGGSSFDPGNDALRLDSLLGKILRIDPRGRPYAVPPDNPFVETTWGPASGDRPRRLRRLRPPAAPLAGRPEIWALGLRNPWRFSFDRQTGDLWIGDVGQDAREEIDFAAAPAAGRGVSYGWRCFEARIATPSRVCTDAQRAGLQPPPVPPVHELTHGDGYASIIGGVVVRDPGVPGLVGRYLYGDIAKPALRSLAAGADREEGALRVSNLSSFGEDACGRVYATSLDGPVYRLQDGTPSACAVAPPAGTPPGSSADRRACRPSVRSGRSQRVLRRRGVRLTLRASEVCTVTIGGRIPGVARLRRTTRRLPARARRVVRMRLSRRSLRAVRQALRRRPLTARVTLSTRDAAGNRARMVKRVRLRR